MSNPKIEQEELQGANEEKQLGDDWTVLDAKEIPKIVEGMNAEVKYDTQALEKQRNARKIELDENRRFADKYLNKKNTGMNILGTVAKTGVITWPFQSIASYFMKKNAKNTLISYQDDLKTVNEALEYNKKLAENRKDILFKEYVNQYQKEPEGNNNNNEPQDTDLEYKKDLGLGFDVRNVPEVGFELPMEERFKQVKEQAYKQIKNNHEKSIKMYQDLIQKADIDVLSTYNDAFNADAQRSMSLNTFSAIVRTMVESDADKEKINVRKKFVADEESHLKEIKKEKEALASKIKKLEDTLAEQQKDYDRDANNYNLAKQVLDKHQKLYDEALADNKQNNTKETAAALAKEKKELETYQEIFNNFSGIYFKKTTTINNAIADLQSYKNDLDELSRSETVLNIKYAKDKELLNQEVALFAKNTALLKKHKGFIVNHRDAFNKAKDIYNNRIEHNKRIDEIDEKLKMLDDDYKYGEVENVLIENGRMSVNTIILDGKAFFDPKEMQEKHLDENQMAEILDLHRLVEKQKITNKINKSPFFKNVNSSKVAEYMTYNEKTASFETFKGDPTDPNFKKHLEQHQAALRQKYFGNDIMFHEHLIKQDPTSYRRNMIASSMTGVWSTIVNGINGFSRLDNKAKVVGQTLWSGLKSFGKFAGGFIPIVKEYISDERPTKDDFAKMEVAMNQIAEVLGYGIMGLNMLDKSNFAQNQLLTTMAQASILKGLYDKGLLSQNGYILNATGIAGFVSSMGQNIKAIVDAKGKKTEQSELARIQLEKGNARFSSMLTCLAQESRKEEICAGIDLGASILQNTFSAATGFTGLALTGVFTGLKLGTKALAKSIQSGLDTKEFLNQEHILGGINYDKNVISDADLNTIIQQKTGFESIDKMVDASKIMDAIDTHRAVKHNVGNVNLDVLAKGMSVRPAKLQQMDLKGILQKLSGNGKDVKERLRSAVEENVYNPGPIKRWFYSIFGLKDRLTGKTRNLNTRKNKIITTKEKQNEYYKNQFGQKDLNRLRAAEILVDNYRTLMAVGNKQIMKTRFLKYVDNQSELLGVFSHIPAADTMTKALVKNGGKNPDVDEMGKIMRNAITQADGLLVKVQAYAKSQNESKKIEQKQEVVNNVQIKQLF